jgi:hypothetical protein
MSKRTEETIALDDLDAVSGGAGRIGDPVPRRPSVGDPLSPAGHKTSAHNPLGPIQTPFQRAAQAVHHAAGQIGRTLGH